MRRIAVLEQENKHLRGENRKLQAQAFGRKSEKLSGGDRSNQLDDPSEAKRHGHPAISGDIPVIAAATIATCPSEPTPHASCRKPNVSVPTVACRW
jgi:hypothetical protein